MRRRIVVIAAAAATVLVGAGVAVAAYVAYLAPEDGAADPAGDAEGARPGGARGPEARAEAAP